MEFAKNNDFSDIAMTSRVRLARNFKGHPFDSTMTDDDRSEIINKVKDAVIESSAGAGKNFHYLRIKSMADVDKQILVEKHLISPEFAGSNKECGVIINDDENISIMINEEDHLRIQTINDGLSLEEAYLICDKVDRLIEEKNDYAFSNTYGYLTGCPSNVGTGMRVSVMLHLPALTISKYIRSILESANKLGIIARGMYGENTEALGNMFQFSNRISLGINEKEIINLVKDVAIQIINKEREVRRKIYKDNPDSLQDKVWRSYGIFKNSRIISTQEALKLLSDIRLGMDMDILEMDRGKLKELTHAIQPGVISKKYGSDMSYKERDVQRANVIRNIL